MLQRLETADRNAELRTALRVLDRLVCEDPHDADSLGADGKRRVVDFRVERRETVADVAEYSVRIDTNSNERKLCRAQAVNSWIGLDRYAIRVGRYRE